MTVVAACQLGLAVGDTGGNLAAAAGAVEAAAAAGAGPVVLPELCDSGYVFTGPAEARALASPAGDCRALRQWQALAAEHDTVIMGGYCELGPDGGLFNSAALVDASGTRAVYRKAHLWDAARSWSSPRAPGPRLWWRWPGRPGERDDLLRPGVPRVGPAGRARWRGPHRGPR